MVRWLTASALLSCAVAAAAQVRPHPYDLNHVKWHVVLDEPTASVRGDVTNVVTPSKGTAEVWFDRGRLIIDSVSIEGKGVPFRISGEKVFVTLPAARRSASRVPIRITYHGQPDAGLYFIPAKRAFPAKTPSIYTQGEMEDTRYWLVTYDYPDDQATSEGIIDVPKGYFALSNGKLMSQRSTATRSIYHWKIDQPHVTYLISIVAGPYEKGHEQWGSLPVDFYVPAGLLDWGWSSFKGTADMVRFFSEQTGFRYPFAKFAQSVVPDYMFGGMENISAVTNTIGTLHPESVKPLADSEGLVLHELAHQWFGDTVTCNSWAHAWINEGWASFLPAFYVRNKKGQEAFDLARYDTFQGGLGAHAAEPGRSVVFGGYKEPLENFDGYIYAGGASRMFMLMDILGEEKFWKATQQYLNERKFTSFDTPAFFQTWSKATGRDLTPFMKQWFYTPAAPKVRVSWRGEELVLSQDAPYFDLDIDVRPVNAASTTVIKLRGPEASIRMPSRSLVLIDPEVRLMMNVEYAMNLTPEERISMFRSALNAAGKARIMDLLLRGLDPQVSLRFARSIESEALLARYVGEIRPTPGAEEFLLELSRSSNAALVDAAIGHFGAFPLSSEIEAALSNRLASSPNELIRQSAFRVLLDLKKDSAMAEAAWTKDGFRDGYRIIALNWWAQHDRDLARSRALQVLANPPTEAIRVNAIGHLGRLKDKAGESRVLNALHNIVRNERSFGARNTAMNALADYGHPSSIEVMKPFQTHSLVFFRQTSKSVIERLRTK